VSALAHYLEEEGLPTVAISLIRPQTEHTRPPRALWVPFELGRPLGPPSDPTFQKRVVSAALRLLERQDGPAILEDFPEDDPRSVPDFNWKSPPTEVPPADMPNIMVAKLMLEEIYRFAPMHERWIDVRSRTTVGLTRLPIGQCAHFVAGWMVGDARPSPWNELSAPMMLRFCVDDLKAYCLEAAAGNGKPSGKQLRDWFWNDTATGSAIRRLRKVLRTSDDERLSRIVSGFMVPAEQIRLDE